MITRGKDEVFKPKVLLATKHPLHYSDIPEPTSFSEANKDLNWRNAVCQEITVPHRNGTWTLVP